MAQLHIDQFFRTDREKLWAIFTDFEASFSQSIDVTVLEYGDPEDNEKGLIREIYINRKKLREKIIKIVPKESIEYQLISGVPVHDYFGIINLLPEKEGTTVRWIVTFKTKFPWPEWLIKRASRKNIKMVLDDIGKAVEE
jgi:hypothetical protein